jgi:hypothetical protein
MFNFESKFKLNKKEAKQVKQFANMIKNRQIPYRIPRFFNDNMSLDVCMLRNVVIHNLGYAMISWKWTNEVAKWINDRKCLEVMAGTGALSYALKKKGVDIITTDNFSWHLNWQGNDKMYTYIENLDAIESVKKYARDVEIIIMSWCYMDDTGYRVLKQMHETNPDCIMLVIGEGHGGCTTDDNFFENLIEIKDYTFRKVQKEFFQWHGIHDYPRLVKLKEEKDGYKCNNN